MKAIVVDDELFALEDMRAMLGEFAEIDAIETFEDCEANPD